MGYTHYWRESAELNREVFKDFAEHCQKTLGYGERFHISHSVLEDLPTAKEDPEL